MTPLATSLAAAATRVLAALSMLGPDCEQDFKDAESSLIAQLQAEEFVPSDWVMHVEHDQMPETDGLVSVFCHTERLVEPAEECWLIIDPTTGEVTRV